LKRRWWWCLESSQRQSGIVVMKDSMTTTWNPNRKNWRCMSSKIVSKTRNLSTKESQPFAAGNDTGTAAAGVGEHYKPNHPKPSVCASSSPSCSAQPHHKYHMDNLPQAPLKVMPS
jgi:hypothetical protein